MHLFLSYGKFAFRKLKSVDHLKAVSPLRSATAVHITSHPRLRSRRSGGVGLFLSCKLFSLELGMLSVQTNPPNTMGIDSPQVQARDEQRYDACISTSPNKIFRM